MRVLDDRRPLEVDKKLSTENPDLDDFAHAVDRSHIFGKSVTKHGDRLSVTFGLTRCVCTIKASRELVSITYCHCCNGHVKKLLEAGLKRPLRADVISSACSGGDDCRFVIDLV